LQHFENDTLALRSKWSQCAIAPNHEWVRAGQNEQTDSKPFDIKDQLGNQGKAKPGCVLPDVSRAAHEKIASDLAALLDLPVPPVTLYELPGPLPACVHTKLAGDPHICVSAWAFSSCDAWSKHASVITEEEKASTIIPLSAIWVFDSWVSAIDRHYGKHILVSPTGTPPLKIACVDYAFSLSRSWAPGASLGAAGWEMPFEVAKRDAPTVEATANRIAATQNDVIEGIVNRIGTGWLPADRSTLILKNLRERRDRIHDIIGIPKSTS
jgi:hypothetical protein